MRCDTKIAFVEYYLKFMNLIYIKFYFFMNWNEYDTIYLKKVGMCKCRRPDVVGDEM